MEKKQRLNAFHLTRPLHPYRTVVGTIVTISFYSKKTNLLEQPWGRKPNVYSAAAGQLMIMRNSSSGRAYRRGSEAVFITLKNMGRLAVFYQCPHVVTRKTIVAWGFEMFPQGEYPACIF